MVFQRGFIISVALASGLGAWRWLKPYIEKQTPAPLQILLSVVVVVAGFLVVYSLYLGLISLFCRRKVLDRAIIRGCPERS